MKCFYSRLVRLEVQCVFHVLFVWVFLFQIGSIRGLDVAENAIVVCEVSIPDWFD